MGVRFGLNGLATGRKRGCLNGLATERKGACLAVVFVGASLAVSFCCKAIQAVPSCREAIQAEATGAEANRSIFELRLDRGVPRIFRNDEVMPSRIFFGSFMHGGFTRSWESVSRQFSYALDAGVPFFETHGDLFWEGCDEAKVAAFNRKRADAFFAVATNRPCWMIVRLLCNPPTWWMDARPETCSGWNDKSKLTGWVAKHPMQTLASSVYQDEALKAIRRARR